jgi:hypothetical protein
MLHEYFAVKEYIAPEEWDVKDISWQKVLAMKDGNERKEFHMIIRYMPECIPFNVRAKLFTDFVE